MQSDDKTTKRAWLSLMTGLAFLAIGVTGILMFFHLRLPGTTQLHEFGGLLFVVVGVWHIKLNWRMIVGYCSRRTGKIALVAGTLVLGAFLALGLGQGQGRGPRPGHGPCAPSATSPHP